MKKLFLFGLVFLLSILIYKIQAQDLPAQQGLEPVSLTPDELFVLSNIPLLQLPEKYKGPNAPLLPQSVDNSTQPYFRPITYQSGYECGQSASIAFNFTYELDRLRGLPANNTNNQYPTHFAWDFLNNANNYQGVSFFDSWEIIKACGTMNVTDYGGALNTGGYLRWITGYDKYYNGMQNRLNYVRAIRADSPEGLLTLKYWLADHLEGAAVGGVGNIYGNYFGTPSTVLPPGTPEAGKYVQTYWGGSPSHAWTICGYNDSIRYDFNGDGKFTNNIDINGDGLVNMHDWEMGGLKFANGYAGPGWSNQGFCYTMYKNIADNIGYGGIWNHTIYVIDIKQTCEPKLTMKLTLNHTSRNKLKVSVGMSTDLGASVPATTLDFPVFNYQGGDYYMQGGTAETDKTIEFGLDLTPLLSLLNSGQPARYFLQVQENDPNGTAIGTIVNWSLIDYTSGSPVINSYPGSNIPIENNTITRLNLNQTINFNKPSIINNSLPPAPLYQPYSVQLTANGGTPPYLWDVKLDYPETISTSPFPTVNAQQLTLTNNNSGYATKVLDFNFPYYKKNINKLYIYADGYIVFDDQPYTWPFLIDKSLLFRQSPVIAPFMADLAINPSQAQGIWYEGNSTSATIRWKASISGMSTTNLNFAVKFYQSGLIEFYYGDMNYPTTTIWTGGISSGDNKNYQYSLLNNATTITLNTLDKFTACGFPTDMQITEDGLFTGTPTQPYLNVPVNFRVTDNNNISSLKNLLFNIYGLLIEYAVESGSDNVIECGETAYLNLTLTNLSTQPVNNILISIANTDPFITLSNPSTTIPVINGGQILTVTHAVSMMVSPNIPNNHPFTIPLTLQAPQQNSQIDIALVAYAPEFHISNVEIVDGDNHRLDPGESADMLLTIKNYGGVSASEINVSLVSADPELTLDVNSGYISMLKPDSAKGMTFHVTASTSVPFEHLYRMMAYINTSQNQNSSDSVYFYSGEIIEDFETENLIKFNWQSAGLASWGIDPVIRHEGSFSGRSGWIIDNQETTLYINVRVLQDGVLSFWKKVSCEHDPSGNFNYDYLTFYIDNYEMQRWDGEGDWNQVSYEVQKGYHTFIWTYHKDYSISSGYDCAFLDFIQFPLIEGAQPHLSASPSTFEKTLDPGQTATDKLYITNTGGGRLSFSALVFDTLVNKNTHSPVSQSGSFLECSTETFIPGQAFSWDLILHNQSNDNENISHVKVDMPPHVKIDTATNFTGGSLGELAYEGTVGTGLPQHWHGELSGGTGVVKPGESAVSTLTGRTDKSFQQDVFLVYNIHGDQAGNSPHDKPGFIRIKNAGLWNSWLSLSGNNGILYSNETAEVSLAFNAGNLPPGNYSCNIIAKDGFNNNQIVPVQLHILNLNSSENPGADLSTSLKGNCPNPFLYSTKIQYNLSDPAEIVFEIFNAQGKKVRIYHQNQIVAGNHFLFWDGNDEQGNTVPAGVYYCRMITPEHSETKSMIRIR